MRVLLLAALALFPLLGQKKVDFLREVRPLLSDRCFACHGPDETKRFAGLRLDTEEGARPAVESGKLLARVTHEKKGLRMPPPGQPELTAAQVDVLKRWVADGAKFQSHWSFVAPKKAAVPEVKDASWPKNEIDRFILARLEKEGLKPSAAADRATLLRRVTLDLTGLPPKPAELTAFLADKSPNAYEKVVDRLLASPHFGERMAVPWLDLSRYADTHGYHIDSHRDMWPWRDWVVSAFNRNLPYDQFTLWQLAGDLLPKPTREQLLATGFNRNHMINYEGGAIPEEYQTEYVIDRVEATSTVWLGLTTGCARCHDHKYDPIRQKEFYRMFAFFNTIGEKGLDGMRGNAEPMLRLPDATQAEKLSMLEAAIAEKEAAIDEADVVALREGWEKKVGSAIPDRPQPGLLAHYDFEGNLNDVAGAYRHAVTQKGELAFSPAAAGRGLSFDGRTEISFPDLTGLESAALWVRVNGRLDAKPSTFYRASGWTIWMDGGEVIGPLKRGSYVYVARNGKTSRSQERVLTGDWTHLAISGDRIFVNGKAQPLVASDEAVPEPWIRASMDDLRLYSRALTDADVRWLSTDYPNRVALTIPPARRSRDQRLRLLEYYFEQGAPTDVKSLNAELSDLYRQRDELQEAMPSAMVMREMGIPRETKVLARGDYRNGTEVVTPGLPSFLPPLPKGAPPNRLGLAQWLVSPENPLTARVAVNRFWAMYFGQGIVKTVEDFGSQGEVPVHPELLDWLAVDFRDNGWDVKALQKKIVMSAAYQQSSRVTPALLDKDPENRLLARGPRFRLPAEFVRDNALAVSGLLNAKLGGPGVYPYQPAGVWEDIAYGDYFTAQKFVADKGANLYRRSMYSFWKRTAPPPGLATFDAPDREKCTARRALTNTPLQALVLLNDPTYVEASRALAVRMLREGGKDPLGWAFQTVLARRPAAKEAAVLRAQADKQLAIYRNYPQGAEQLLRVGESPVPADLDKARLAAWTTVASVILNLDETITKE